MVKFLLLNGVLESNFGRESFEGRGNTWLLGWPWAFSVTLGHGEKRRDVEEEKENRDGEKRCKPLVLEIEKGAIKQGIQRRWLQILEKPK